MLTQEKLKSILHYDSDTGIFTRLTSRGGNNVGSIAGNFDKGGYLKTNIQGKTYRTHRLAWLYIYGEFPPEEIDHINCVRNDNRLLNLRLSTRSENTYNTSIFSNNTSGYKCVSWNKKSKKWRAYCNVNGKQNHLGLFETAEQASIAYQNFARTNHGKFCNIGTN
jgi:hypothetical protein